jgi:hypothetical protein
LDRFHAVGAKSEDWETRSQPAKHYFYGLPEKKSGSPVFIGTWLGLKLYGRLGAAWRCPCASARFRDYTADMAVEQHG